jgi:hypothetical protein
MHSPASAACAAQIRAITTRAATACFLAMSTQAYLARLCHDSVGEVGMQCVVTSLVSAAFVRGSTEVVYGISLVWCNRSGEAGVT